MSAVIAKTGQHQTSGVAPPVDHRTEPTNCAEHSSIRKRVRDPDRMPTIDSQALKPVREHARSTRGIKRGIKCRRSVLTDRWRLADQRAWARAAHHGDGRALQVEALMLASLTASMDKGPHTAARCAVVVRQPARSITYTRS